MEILYYEILGALFILVFDLIIAIIGAYWIFEAKAIENNKESDGFVKSSVAGIFGGLTVWLLSDFIYGQNFMSLGYWYSVFTFVSLLMFFGGFLYRLYRRF